MRIYEIFTSIDGEVNCYGQGHVSTFIRLAGCNLNCFYCDSQKAKPKNSGVEVPISEIIKDIYNRGINKVTITGGEPLLQKDNLMKLVFYLMTNKIKVTIETNGSLPIFNAYDVPYIMDSKYLGYVIDYKCPSSGVSDKMLPDKKFIKDLEKKDIIKFVIGDYVDCDFAITKMKTFKKKGCKSKFAFSTIHDKGLDFTKDIVDICIKYKLNVIINVQMHKLLNLR